MRANTRLNALELKIRTKAPILCIFESHGEPGMFRYGGKLYTREELDGLKLDQCAEKVLIISNDYGE